MKVVSIVGNRPQFVKSAPMSLALRAREAEEIVLHTGQHYDRELSQIFFEELDLAEPEYRLDLHSANPRLMRPGIASALQLERPDWVLVYGDTNSTLAGAQAGVEAGVPIAHVEAGLRSGDLGMPEERNRIEVDTLADLLLCPDEGSSETLRAEAVAGRIEVVGDVMADAFRLFEPIARRRSHVLERFPALSENVTAIEAGQYLVLTIHREANVQPDRLRRIVSSVNGIGSHVVFPVHPRTLTVLEANGIRPAPYVRTIAPLGYLDMLALVAQARVLLTDSGGLQKEAYWLGTPCITLRPSTEWVDTVRVGANRLWDPAGDEPLVLGDPQMPAERPELYGDGHAADRVVEALEA